MKHYNIQELPSGPVVSATPHLSLVHHPVWRVPRKRPIRGGRSTLCCTRTHKAVDNSL